MNSSLPNRQLSSGLASDANGAGYQLGAPGTHSCCGTHSDWTLSVGVTMLNWFSVASCFFIAYLSIRALKDSFNSSAVPEPHTTPLRKNHRSGLMTGFIVGISNPKDIIFLFFPHNSST